MKTIRTLTLNEVYPHWVFQWNTNNFNMHSLIPMQFTFNCTEIHETFYSTVYHSQKVMSYLTYTYVRTIQVYLSVAECKESHKANRSLPYCFPFGSSDEVSPVEHYWCMELCVHARLYLAVEFHEEYILTSSQYGCKCFKTIELS